MDNGTIALVATLVSVALAVLGLLAAWYWRQRGSPAKAVVEAGDRSVAAGRDVTGQVSTGDQTTIGTKGGVQFGPGHTGPVTIQQQGLDEESRERLVRIEAKLDEVKERLAAPPPGASAPNTQALAAQATERTERLLDEAIELQHQHKERDALERLLTAYDMEMSPTAKAQLHILAGNGFLRLSELEEAEGHYRQALSAAEQAQDKLGQATVLGNLGIVYDQRGDLKRAEGRYKKALAIAEEIGNRLTQANQLGNLGLAYQHRGELDKAEEHFKRALAIHEESGDRLGQAAALGNLGSVYFQRGDLEKAEEHLKKALDIQEEIGDRLVQAIVLGNLGLVYADRGDLEKAEEHYKKALAIDEEIGNEVGQAIQLGNLANVYFQRGDLEKAEEHLKRALAIHEEIGNRLGEASQLGNLGLLAVQRGQVEKARDLLRQAADLYEATGAGGEGPEIVRKALQRLEAAQPKE